MIEEIEKLEKKIVILEIKNDLAKLEAKLSEVKSKVNRLPFSFDMGKHTKGLAKKMILDDMEVFND